LLVMIKCAHPQNVPQSKGNQQGYRSPDDQIVRSPDSG
jgi:hypothetical protein